MSNGAQGSLPSLVMTGVASPLPPPGPFFTSASFSTPQFVGSFQASISVPVSQPGFFSAYNFAINGSGQQPLSTLSFFKNGSLIYSFPALCGEEVNGIQIQVGLYTYPGAVSQTQFPGLSALAMFPPDANFGSYRELTLSPFVTKFSYDTMTLTIQGVEGAGTQVFGALAAWSL